MRRKRRVTVAVIGASLAIVGLPVPGAGAALPHPGTVNVLQGVAATSVANAWAVGWYCRRLCKTLSPPTRALTMHWNGRRWSKVRVKLRGKSELAAVTATSRKNAWAVGNIRTASGSVRTLTLHWNGRRWLRIPSPSAGNQGSWLTGVSQPSRSARVWAVGYYDTPTGSRGLFMYWSRARSAWIRVGSTPATDDARVTAVATARHASPGVVGFNGQHDTTLAYQLVGKKWIRRSTPNPGTLGYNDTLAGAAETSSSDAWAVGTYSPDATSSATLILHWNGLSWAQVGSPSPGRAAFPRASLWGVSATSRTDAWAVGDDISDIRDDDATVALHWDGSAWGLVATPDPSTSNVLRAVAASSRTSAFAVGFTCPGGGNCGNPVEPVTNPTSILILHWNGASWTAM